MRDNVRCCCESVACPMALHPCMTGSPLLRASVQYLHQDATVPFSSGYCPCLPLSHTHMYCMQTCYSAGYIPHPCAFQPVQPTLSLSVFSFLSTCALLAISQTGILPTCSYAKMWKLNCVVLPKVLRLQHWQMEKGTFDNLTLQCLNPGSTFTEITRPCSIFTPISKQSPVASEQSVLCAAGQDTHQTMRGDGNYCYP